MLSKKEMRRIESIWQFYDRYKCFPFDKKAVSFRINQDILIKLKEKSKLENRKISSIVDDIFKSNLL